jgi:hypothetical protein
MLLAQKQSIFRTSMKHYGILRCLMVLRCSATQSMQREAARRHAKVEESESEVGL